MRSRIGLFALVVCVSCTSGPQTEPVSPVAVVDTDEGMVQADGYDPTVSISASGLNVTWRNLSGAAQIGRVAWYCYSSWTAQRLADYKQINIPARGYTTAVPRLPSWTCGKTCQVDVGYLTPWPPPVTGGPPVFGGLLAATYGRSTAVCPTPTPAPQCIQDRTNPNWNCQECSDPMSGQVVCLVPRGTE